MLFTRLGSLARQNSEEMIECNFLKLMESLAQQRRVADEETLADLRVLQETLLRNQVFIFVFPNFASL